MDKYLGNKRSLLNRIYNVVMSLSPSRNTICDAFAGTTNVGRMFHAREWEVHSMDANRLSSVLGRAYFGMRRIPKFNGLREILKSYSSASPSVVENHQRLRDRDSGDFGSPLQLPPPAEYDHYMRIITALNDSGNLGKIEQPNTIFNFFTKWGSKSAFTSVRGSKGKRNYFSRENAIRMDRALAHIRHWYRNGDTSVEETMCLLASVIEEAVITANVNGTFHDFNRSKLWPNSLQDFSLKALPLSHRGSSNRFYTGDSISLCAIVPEHSVLYLDPPYNFRQYTAYYHFLNFISAYPFIEDLDDYLNGLAFVRGQNPDDDFTSSLCKKSEFIPGLCRLINSARCEYVVLSYFSGRNHWNHWSDPNGKFDQGVSKLSELFSNKMRFESWDLVSLDDVRLNYQSRVGEFKDLVTEYLFIGKKKKALLEPFGLSQPIESSCPLGLPVFAATS